MTELRKYSEPNNNETLIYKNVWETARAERRRKFVTLKANIRKKKGSILTS